MEVPKDINFDPNHERVMLRYKLDLLEKFDKDHEYEPEDAAEECRMLQYKIECLQGVIVAKNLGEDFTVQYQQRHSITPAGFTKWADQRAQNTSRLSSGGLVKPPATVYCPHKPCINYVYGFLHLESLKQHLHNHPSIYDQYVRHGSTSSISSVPTVMDLDKDEEVEDQQLTYVPFNPLSSLNKKRPGDYLPHRTKRILDTENMRLVKDLGACLRCKILKKKCDNRHPCSHCPSKDNNNKGDHWKVLGCHRSSLKDLSKLLLPQNDAESKYDLGYQALDYLSTNTLPTALNSVQDESSPKEIQQPIPSDELFTLNWTTTAKGLLAIAESHKDFPIATAYNPLDLMRNSRKICEDSYWQNAHQTELDLVHGMISEVIDFYLSKKSLDVQTSTSENFASEIHHSLGDEKLRNFLEAFSDSCSRRNSLSIQSWLSLFHSLCLFSIYKNLLIDAYALPSSHRQPNTFKYSNAVEIDSVYRTLVSIFTWASGVKDPLISEDEQGEEEEGGLQEILKGTKELVRQGEWGKLGIKLSKEFLMMLGSGMHVDGSFNGFVVRTYRLEKSFQRHPLKPRKSTDLPVNNGLSGMRSQQSSQSPSSTPSGSHFIANFPSQDLNAGDESTTTKTAVVAQWLDGLSGTSRNIRDEDGSFVVLNRRKSNLPILSAESLGGTHTESWLVEDNHHERHDPPGAPFAHIFEDL